MVYSLTQIHSLYIECAALDFVSYQGRVAPKILQLPNHQTHSLYIGSAALDFVCYQGGGYMMYFYLRLAGGTIKHE